MAEEIRKPSIGEEVEFPGIQCPICRLWRPLVKKGTRARAEGKPLDKKEPGAVRLDWGELDQFIDIRSRAKGRGGFYRIKTISLKEAKNLPEYNNIIDQLKFRCQQILDILG